MALRSHTYSHGDLHGLAEAAVRAEVRRGAYWIRRGAQQNLRSLSRFPAGARDARTVAVVNSMGVIRALRRRGHRFMTLDRFVRAPR